MKVTRSMMALALAAVAAVMAAGPVPGRRGQRWLEPDAKVRRIIACEQKPTGLPGDDVGVVTFFTGGMADPGGRDVRVHAVSDSQTRPVRHRVIMVGPGDRLRVAFAMPGGFDRFHVYYGDPKASAPAETLDVRRGLLFEVRTGDAANADRVEQIERAFRRAKPQGAAFVDNIFFGFNPFGPSEGFISHFVGWLDIRTAGRYRIATTSDDCSFVLIDGRLVVAWPGGHGAVADARHNAPVMLGTGLHKLDYWHAQAAGGCVAEAAWLVPGGKRFEVIPKTAFAPVAIATLEDIRIKGQGVSPDFFAERAGESFFHDDYAIRVELKNLSAPAAGANLKYRWDFGDGQTSTEKSPSHVYLRSGAYKVQLTVTWGPQRAAVTNRLLVERNWWKQSMNQVEPLGPYARQVARYDIGNLDAASLARAADLFEKVRQPTNRTGVLEALVFRARNVPERLMARRSEDLAQLYVTASRHDDAVRVYRRAEAQVQSRNLKAMAAIAAGRVLLDRLDRAVDADREFRRALKDYAAAPALTLRDAHIGLGDAACRRGDREAARTAYAAAEKIPVGGLASKNPTLRISSLARYVEEYVRTKDFDSAEEFLRTWYREFPSHRLSGEAPLQEARLRFAQERWGDVIRVAGELVGVNRDSPFAPQVLFVSAEAALKLDRVDAARRALAQIVDDYPESERRKEAAALLEKLGGAPPPPAPTP